MISGTNRWILSGLAALALTATACNPYPAANSDPPKIVRVLAYDRLQASDPIVVETPNADGSYTINHINVGTPVPGPDIPTIPAGEVSQWRGTSIMIQFNKQMDPLSIQSAPTQDSTGTPNNNACVPAAGITVTGPVEAGVTRWLTCYFPGQPDTTVGSEMLIWKATLANGTDPRSSRIPAGATITVVGTVQDQSGNKLNINLTAITDAVP